MLSWFPGTTHGCCLPSPGAGNAVFSSDPYFLYFIAKIQKVGEDELFSANF
jgi:hypothetical protein